MPEPGEGLEGEGNVDKGGDVKAMGERLAVLESKLKESEEGRQHDKDEFENTIVGLKEEFKKEPPVKLDAGPGDEGLDDPSLNFQEYHKKYIKPLLDGFKGELDKRTGAVGQALGYLESRMNIEKSITSAERAHQDFHDYDAEMIKVSKENPTFDVEAVYRLSKLNTVERAEAVKVEKENKVAAARKLATEQPGGPGGKLGSTPNLTSEQAVDLAFEKVVGKKS